MTSTENNNSTNNNVTTVRAVSRDLFSATIGSVCCCYVGQPFDTVKVRMQTSPDLFSSVVGSTTSIIRNEGIPALWKGAVPTAGGMVLENCMAFGVNEALKRTFPTDPAKKALGGPPDLIQPFIMVGSRFLFLDVLPLVFWFLLSGTLYGMGGPCVRNRNTGGIGVVLCVFVSPQYF
jgi:hypothetical protein